jgi:hypothetical protein
MQVEPSRHDARSAERFTTGSDPSEHGAPFATCGVKNTEGGDHSRQLLVESDHARSVEKNERCLFFSFLSYIWGVAHAAVGGDC